ncbi:MAG: transporter substrate-binding domain-containing protein [Prevotella sp.]|nr:transporter substrate-binding domain-containing protein [Prevotella sp.]
MKSRYLHIVLLLALVSQIRADNLGFTKEKPLVFGMDMDYAPLEYIDEQGKPCGYDVEFTQELMKRLNIPITYAPNTWENIADDILSGKVDLGMMVYSTYRKNLTNYSRAVFKLYYQIVFREGENHETGIRNVESKHIALMESRPIIDTLSKAGANIHLVKDLKLTMKELSAGKYDAVICFRYQSRFLINTLELKNLVAEDLTLMSREYCYVSNNEKLIEAINVELSKMEKEGIIDDVYGKIKTEFSGLVIPMWVWFLVAGLIIVSLLVFGIMQRLSKKRLQKEVERAVKSEQRAIKSEELKDIFLSNLSHALRTPLNAIIGFSDLMLTTPEGEMPDEERTQLLNLINGNGLQLLHLINELLSLSDIEGNNTLFDRQVTDIDMEMTSYAAEIRQQLPESVKMEVVEPIGGIRALLDAKLLRVVTMHLLENAMQHTTEGKITLTYYVKEDGLYVEVKDTGTGLPDTLKENIFTLLSDKNTYVQDETPGLGLSICKAIIDRSGGEIGARDNVEDGHGTIVWFWSSVKVLN